MLSFQFLNDRSFIRYSGAFYYFIGLQNQLFSMLFFLPFNIIIIKQFFVFRFYLTHIRNKNIISLFFPQHSCASTAFTSSEYD